MNRTSSDHRDSQFLICTDGKSIDYYDFNVELIAQVSTSMHGSKENHMGYIYRRTKPLSQNGTNSSPYSNKKPDPETLTVDESKSNPCFPAAHSVVKFHYQSHRGRYAVADEDIEVCKITCSVI